MNRFLISSFVAFMLVFSVHVSTVFADAGGTANGSACDLIAGSGKADGIMKDGVCISASTYESQSAAANTPTDYSSSKDDAAYNGIMMRIMTLFAWLVGVAAITLDNAVYYTVVTMGNYVGHLSAIGVTWRILRDIGNIALIFGFLGIGISVILNVNWYGGKTKMLPMLLVAAVFLNFSLFFTEAVIDTGNLFATQFYKQINGGNAASAKNFDAATISNDGISNKIMAQLGLQTIYGQVRQTNKAQEMFKGGNPWIVGFMGILLFIITAFVFFSLAFVLISRFIYLIFLIIFAPIGFAGLAVPQLKARADKWWSALFAQTITAPVLLLLLYVALAVITDAQFLTGFGTTKDWTGFVNGNYTGFASMMLSFLVAMGLLLLVTIQAKNLSAFGAGKATALAGKLTFGATAFGLRSTAGAGLNAASRRFRNSKLARVPVVGRAFSGVLDRGAKASFDVRGAGALGGLKGLGIDAGVAQKGGYQAEEKAAIKGREDYAKTLGQTKDEKTKQGVEEGRTKMMEKTVEEIGKQNKEEAKNLQERHKEELGQTSNEVERIQKNLAKMKSDQQMGASITDAEIAAAQSALTAAQTVRKQKVATQLREQEELDEAHKKMIEVKKAEVKAQQDIVDKLKRAGQEGYAANITWGPGQFFNRNTKAAENIRKEAKKGKSEKDLEKIKKFLEEDDKPKEKPPEAH